MMIKQQYSEYLYANNKNGSGKAHSYLNAIKHLEEVLTNVKTYNKFKNLYKVNNIDDISSLYKFIIEQQKIGHGGIFSDNFKRSYWNKRHYSSAIKSYQQFLIVHNYEQQLDEKIFSETNGKRIAEIIIKQPINYIDKLEIAVDSNKTGVDTLQLTKSRVNQNYFRKIVLHNYNNSCGVNGLNIPEVLRASHIVGWAKNKENRLNPENGICLSATYDAAFDRHLISFDDNYKMILSKSLNEFMSNDAFQKHFKAFEGKQIMMPK